MSYFGNAVYPVPLVNPANVVTVNTSTGLSQASYGKTFICTAAGNTTMTLTPLLSGSVTQQVTFVNDSSTGIVTINASGSDTIRALGVGVHSFTLTPGDVCILENNGAAWSIVDNSSWKANLGGANFTGPVTGLAPNQFDSSTLMPTTGFVQNIGLRGVPLILSGVTTLAASTAGSNVLLTGVAAYTSTMPTLASVPAGTMYEFTNTTSFVQTLGRQGTDTFSVAGPSLTTIGINPGDSVFVTSINGIWIVSGSGTLGRSSSFAGSIAANGYQKLPTGLIIQWGTGNTGPNNTAIGGFPIAFPTAAFTFTCGAYGVSFAGGAGGFVSGQPISLSQYELQTTYVDSTVTVSWIATGN